MIPVDNPEQKPVTSNSHNPRYDLSKDETLKEENFVPDYIEEVVVENITIKDEENVFRLEQEIVDLKNTLQKERTDFERYIGNMENTKSKLKNELDSMKKQMEKMKKEEPKNSEKETEDVVLKTNRKRKYSDEPRIKSVVHIPNKRR